MPLQLPRPVRDALRPLAGRVPVPIISGPNRGLKWSLASAGGGYASGRRALDQMRFLEALVHSDDIVWDVGAHHGYVTLCLARQVASPKQVHAFEPSARNHPILERHLRWNGMGEVTVHRVALSDRDGTARFGGGASTKTGALGHGDEVVETRRGSSIVDSGTSPPPTLIKVDVEDTEAAMLRGVLDHLPAYARLVIAVHSRRSYEECRPLLIAHHYRLVESVELRRSREGTWRKDPDLLALGAAAAEPSAAVRELGYLVR